MYCYRLLNHVNQNISSDISKSSHYLLNCKSAMFITFYTIIQCVLIEHIVLNSRVMAKSYHIEFTAKSGEMDCREQ